METHHITPARGLSETGLKWVALVTMVLDHIHYFFSFTGCVPEWFSMVGRLGAPLFLFCLVEGFTHTRSRKRYFARVYVLSTAMSLLFFFMAFAHVLVRPDGFYPGNGMMTTFAVLMVIWQGIDWVRAKKYGKGIAAIVAVVGWPYLFAAVLGMFPQLMQRPIVSTVLAFVITSPVPMWTSITDGGWGYLVSGVLLYLLRNHRKAQVAVWALNSFLWDFVLVYLQLRGQPGFELSQMFTTYYEWFGVAAAVLMLAYNGMRGSGHKQLFYWFYPAHVYLLYGVSCLVYRLIA